MLTLQVIAAVSQGPAKEMGPVKPYRPPPPWKSTALGHIPSPKTPRAKFFNSFLPEFYKTKFKHCKNNKKFVKEFHGAGRELYHLIQQLYEIDNQVKSIMNKESPAVLDEVHTLITRDNLRIKNNIQKAMQIIASVSLIDNKIKPFDSKLFSSNGKLKSGEKAIHKFFENQ